MRQLKRHVASVAVVDGLVVLVLLGMLLALGGVPQSPSGWALAASGGATLALIASWRGYRHAQRVLAGTASWSRPVLEGFAIGFCPPFALLVLPAVNTAIAAGTVYDGAATWGTLDWAR